MRELTAILMASLALAAGARASEPDTKIASTSPLPHLLTIEWRKGASLPQGFQDSKGDILGQTLVSVCGFCSGQNAVPGKASTYPRGFLKNVWGLDLSMPSAGWRSLPEFPGDARQGLQAIRVGDRLYCWGGFSYSPPFCYRDGYCLSRTNDRWVWEPLPPLPWPLTAAGICAIGSKIYISGGADYDLNQFFTEHGRAGDVERLGARLFVIDTAQLDTGWQQLQACPGTPRWVHAMAAVNGRLYILGGATGSDNPGKSTYTVVDNWCFDVASSEWNRLADLPVASGNFPAGPITFDDRYIILVGGYQYGEVLAPDGTARPAYGVPQRHYSDNPMCSDVFVYDTKTASFGRATPLPLNNNLPMTVLRGDKLNLIGGEIQSAQIDGEHFGHHPDLYLVGTLSRK